MNTFFCLVLATLSIWEYPSLQSRHEALRHQLLTSIQANDTEKMLDACRKAVKLVPDDPTWQYNLACALARDEDCDVDEALDALEKAIDLGFRDEKAIAKDPDLKVFELNRRYLQLIEYAREMRETPIMFGPLSAVAAMGTTGSSVVLGAHNLSWNFEVGCFEARLSLSPATGGNAGDLYMNRDAGHSVLSVQNFPGLTTIRLDEEGRTKKMDVDLPNMLFPYPVFGNCSRGYVKGLFWRSIPRAAMTTQSPYLPTLAKLYLSNQIWVLPAVNDYPPQGEFGDVFASVMPYMIVTQGRSWSDQPYLAAALEVSRQLPAETKAEVVKQGLLAPVIQALIRKSLKGVTNEVAYLTAAAHPTCMPAGGLDLARLRQLAGEMTVDAIPPVARISGVVIGQKEVYKGLPEITYATPCAWAFVLRSPETNRLFRVQATGGTELAFAIVHDEKNLASLKQISPTVAEITIHRAEMTPTNRIDLAIFARTEKSLWGAPSFVSFAVVDPKAPYSDPMLTPREAPAADEEKPEAEEEKSEVEGEKPEAQVEAKPAVADEKAGEEAPAKIEPPAVETPSVAPKPCPPSPAREETPPRDPSEPTPIDVDSIPLE